MSAVTPAPSLRRLGPESWAVAVRCTTTPFTPLPESFRPSGDAAAALLRPSDGLSPLYELVPCLDTAFAPYRGALADAHRTRAADEAAVAERPLAAREMRGTVAHGIDAPQTGAEARGRHEEPVPASEAMRRVQQAGRDTLAGLRRTPGAPLKAEPAPRQGVYAVERLAEPTSAADMELGVAGTGERRPLPPGVDETSDRGRGPARHGAHGFRLPGMRERAALPPSESGADGRPGGGFRLAAALRVPAGAR
ncbi:hypothetical protein [Streptomyces sp. NPDC101166]|uniref:hypothetical protein n=1 Tax=Streptomyces sp. NPDC101166 TaxID=3366120 RepID=UPI00381B8E57